MKATHSLVGLGTLGVGVLYAVGAIPIKSDAGYAGVGPNFLPWVVSIALMICGVLLFREAHRGGFRYLEDPSGADRGDWPAFLWVSAGILLNAASITTIGFILSCALCFMLAVRGFKIAEGRRDFSAKAWVVDYAVGAAIAAPVFWLFTQLLAINLPGLTQTGWL